MKEEPLASITDNFGDIQDSRVQGRCDYPLIEVITIAISAVIAGANSWVEIEGGAANQMIKSIDGKKFKGRKIRMNDADSGGPRNRF